MIKILEILQREITVSENITRPPTWIGTAEFVTSTRLGIIIETYVLFHFESMVCTCVWTKYRAD